MLNEGDRAKYVGPEGTFRTFGPGATGVIGEVRPYYYPFGYRFIPDDWTDAMRAVLPTGVMVTVDEVEGL